ncbi:MAG: hypothetical protein ACQETH_03790 [Candidatus Rifleibacteriota bacterium]
MILSIGLIISAFRSLSREFNGILIKKSMSTAIVSSEYWLYLLSPEQLTIMGGEDELTEALAIDNGSNLDLNRVGVSEIVYTQAQKLFNIKKKAFSPFILVQSQSFIDLGVNWFLFGIAGILLSMWMYRQTLKKPTPSNKYESEEIELP